MHTVEYDQENEYLKVGYHLTIAGARPYFTTLIACKDFRIAVEFASYLNGGEPPDSTSWAHVTPVDKFSNEF